jgi:large subunit ribosomal protein L15
MQVHEIKREHALKKKKTVGRGGRRGKTSGRGGKGQTARAGNKRRPAMRDIIKKLPKLRGHGKNRSESVFYRGPEAVVNVGLLSVFNAGDLVNPTTLQAKKLINVRFDKTPRVKILGTGELTIKLNFEECEVSETAKAKIEKAGGTITAPIIDPVVVAMQANSAAKTKAKEEKKKAKKGGK